MNKLYDNKTYSLKRNSNFMINSMSYLMQDIIIDFCTNSYEMYLTGYTLFTLQAHGIFPQGKQSCHN